MSYATVPAAPSAVGSVDERGRARFHVSFTESGVAAASTTAITGLPETGTITLVHVTGTFTTGATVNPRIGKTVGFVVNDANWIGTNSTTAARINDATNLRYSGLVGGTLYWRSCPNAGSDTATTVVLDVIEGHWS